MSVRSPPPLWLVGRSARIAQNPGKDGVVSLGKSFVDVGLNTKRVLGPMFYTADKPLLDMN